MQVSEKSASCGAGLAYFMALLAPWRIPGRFRVALYEVLLPHRLRQALAEAWIVRAVIGAGDFHAGNIMRTLDGDLLGIDMADAGDRLNGLREIPNPFALSSDLAPAAFAAVASAELWSALEALDADTIRRAAAATGASLERRDLAAILGRRDEMLALRPASAP